jgi:hypothetical protein
VTEAEVYHYLEEPDTIVLIRRLEPLDPYFLDPQIHGRI